MDQNRHQPCEQIFPVLVGRYWTAICNRQPAAPEKPGNWHKKRAKLLLTPANLGNAGVMLTDARTLKEGHRLQADICIAGAGAAGITLARSLAGSGLSLLLLESGGFEFDEATQQLYEGSVVGQEYWALHTSRLRFFGGSTNHWTGWCRPLDPIDFEARPGMLGGWPIDYAELLPYYSLAQSDCELDRFDYSAESWAQRYRVHLIPMEDPQWETIAWQFSPPTRFGERYRDELITRDDVQLVTHANLANIGVTNSGERVEHLQVRVLNGPALSVNAKAFVLALGGLENPRILLASNDMVSAGVGNQRGAVGRYFSDHPHSLVGQIIMSAEYTETGYTGIFREGEGTYVRFSWALSEQARRSLNMPGLSVTLDPLAADATKDDLRNIGVGSLMEQLSARPTKATYGLFLRAEQPPNPASRVRLGRKRDALGVPRIELDWRVPHALHNKVREAVKMLAISVGRNSIGRILSFPHADTRPANGWPTLWGGHHHLGTTRMSEDARYGVVDRNCRVHGVDNLFCAGSSTFATAGYANPTLTICALARRLGDYLREQYS